MAIKEYFLAVILSLVIGCSGNPVPVELPQNHPADPGAPESRFIFPPDPFGNEMTGAHPQVHDQFESPAGQSKTRGNLSESPAGHSAPPGQERKEADRSPAEMPHHHNMEKGQ